MSCERAKKSVSGLVNRLASKLLYGGVMYGITGENHVHWREDPRRDKPGQKYPGVLFMSGRMLMHANLHAISCRRLREPNSRNNQTGVHELHMCC